MSSYNNHHNDRLTVFLGNLSPNCVQGDFHGVNGLFKNLEVDEVRLVRDRETNAPRGHGYAVFKNQDSLEKALEMDGSVICGQQIKIDLKRASNNNNNRGENRQQHYGGQPRQQQQGFGDQQRDGPRPVPNQPPFVAFVANLPDGASDQDLATMFKSLDIKSCNVAMDKQSGEPRNFGFAEFNTRDSLVHALTLNGAEWMEKKLRVTVHEPRGQRDQNQQQQRSSFTQSNNNNNPRWNNNNSAFGQQMQRGQGQGGEERKSTRPVEVLPTELDDKDRPRFQWKTSAAAAADKPASAPASTPAAAGGKKSNPFGNAKPVDTASKLKTLEESKATTAAPKEVNAA